MPKRRTYYCMPDSRTVTSSSAKYVKAWKDLAKPIEKEFDLRLAGFDPDFLFYTKNDGLNTSITLPVWFVKRLNEKMK